MPVPHRGWICAESPISQNIVSYLNGWCKESDCLWANNYPVRPSLKIEKESLCGQNGAIINSVSWGSGSRSVATGYPSNHTPNTSPTQGHIIHILLFSNTYHSIFNIIHAISYPLQPARHDSSKCTIKKCSSANATWYKSDSCYRTWEPLYQQCCVCTVRDEEPYEIDMTTGWCNMQRSRPVLVLGWHVGTMLDEEPYLHDNHRAMPHAAESNRPRPGLSRRHRTRWHQ
jgi:hypothetical protein